MANIVPENIDGVPTGREHGGTIHELLGLVKSNFNKTLHGINSRLYKEQIVVRAANLRSPASDVVLMTKENDGADCLVLKTTKSKSKAQQARRTHKRHRKNRRRKRSQ